MAANPLKGQVSVVVGQGPDARTLTLVFSINALCLIEDKLDASIADIGERMAGAPRLGLLRTLLWAGLQDHHPEISERLAGELIPQIGMEEIGRVITEAFTLAFPTEAAEPPAGPQPAAADADGTG